MNIDMVTTVLDDFATFWSNIWKVLKPIFELANPEEGNDSAASSLSFSSSDNGAGDAENSPIEGD